MGSPCHLALIIPPSAASFWTLTLSSLFSCVIDEFSIFISMHIYIIFLIIFFNLLVAVSFFIQFHSIKYQIVLRFMNSYLEKMSVSTISPHCISFYYWVKLSPIKITPFSLVMGYNFLGAKYEHQSLLSTCPFTNRREHGQDTSQSSFVPGCPHRCRPASF